MTAQANPATQPLRRYPSPINVARVHSEPVIECDEHSNPLTTPLPNRVGVQSYTNNSLYAFPDELPCIYVPVPEDNEVLHDSRMNNIGNPLTPILGDEYNGKFPPKPPKLSHYYTYAQVKIASYALNAMWGERCVPEGTQRPVFSFVGFNCSMSGHPDYTSCFHQVSAQYANRTQAKYNLTTYGRGADGERIFAKCLDPSIDTSSIDELIQQNCVRSRDIRTTNFTTKLHGMKLVRFDDCIGDFVIRRNHTMIEVKFIKDLVYHLEAALGRFICTIYCCGFKLQDEHFTLGVFCSCDQNVFTQLLFGIRSVLIVNFYRITESIAEFINNHLFKDIFELADEAIAYASDGYSDEVRQHATECIIASHHQVYQRNRNGKLNGYITTGNILTPNDPRKGHRLDDGRQYIGISGYEVEDFEHYIPNLMSFRMIKVNGSDIESRMDAYYQGIRLIIQHVPDDAPLTFEQHFDVSVIYVPKRLLDWDLMFMINNCLWSSMFDICHNIARNTFHNKLLLYHGNDLNQIQRLEALDQCFYVTVLPELEHKFRPIARKQRRPLMN